MAAMLPALRTLSAVVALVPRACSCRRRLDLARLRAGAPGVLSRRRPVRRRAAPRHRRSEARPASPSWLPGAGRSRLPAPCRRTACRSRSRPTTGIRSRSCTWARSRSSEPPSSTKVRSSEPSARPETPSSPTPYVHLGVRVTRIRTDISIRSRFCRLGGAVQQTGASPDAAPTGWGAGDGSPLREPRRPRQPARSASSTSPVSSEPAGPASTEPDRSQPATDRARRWRSSPAPASPPVQSTTESGDATADQSSGSDAADAASGIEVQPRRPRRRLRFGSSLRDTREATAPGSEPADAPVGSFHARSVPVEERSTPTALDPRAGRGSRPDEHKGSRSGSGHSPRVGTTRSIALPRLVGSAGRGRPCRQRPAPAAAFDSGIASTRGWFGRPVGADRTGARRLDRRPDVVSAPALRSARGCRRRGAVPAPAGLGRGRSRPRARTYHLW